MPFKPRKRGHSARACRPGCISRFQIAPGKIRSSQAPGACHRMMLKLAEELPLAAPREDVWKLLRDAPRFAGLLPGVESVRRSAQDGTEAYAAQVNATKLVLSRSH